LDDHDSGQQMKINVKTKITYNGQEYSSVEELPPEGAPRRRVIAS
jgi:hypothetical protein